MIARNIEVQIKIASKDVTKDLEPFFLSATYEDAASGETDTCEVELMDEARKFLGDWFPTRGDTLEIEFLKRNWGDGQQTNLFLGLFEIDEIGNSFPPARCKIKGNSVSQNSALRQTDKSRSWENVKLSAIARQIASEAGLELFFDAEDDPQIQRAEQSEISSLKFLEKLCADNYLSLKVSDGKLIIFDTAKFEQAEPVMTIDGTDSNVLLHFDGNATIQEVYKSAEVVYKHGKQDELFQGGFSVPDKTDGKVLKINQKVESQAEAERLARNKLREKNKDEVTISLDCIGDFRLLSGNVIELVNCGFYSGKYLIDKARHAVGTGYKVNVECHKCLGY